MHDFEKKLDWARQHLRIVQESFRDFLGSDGYSVEIEYHREQRQYVARIRAAKPVPDAWSLMVGDVVHNIRSALDALTHQLSMKHTPGLTERQIVDIQFLICETDVEFSSPRGQRRLAHVHPDVRTAMRGLQPYHGQHGAGASPLSVLRDLSNIDKHRHLVLSDIILQGTSTFFSPPNGPKRYRSSDYAGPFVDGAIVGQWPELGEGLDPCMHMDPNVVVDIAFGQGTPAPNRSVRRTIEQIIAHIEVYVVAVLRPFL